MKKIYSIFLTTLLIMFGCGYNSDQAQEKKDANKPDLQKEIVQNDSLHEESLIIEESNDTTVQVGFEDLDTIYVGKDREFKNLVAVFRKGRNNVHVIMDPGTYINESDIWLSGNNFIIEGKGHVEIQCKELYANVMWLAGENIIVRNLHLKHFEPGTIEYQNCTGRVIALDNATNVLIENCDINGCGLVGIHDNIGNSNITIKDNYIHYNSLAPFGDIEGNIWMEEIEGHPVFTFVNNRVENNGADRVPEYIDTLNYSNMSDTQNTEIDSLINYWSKNGRKECYKKYKVKPNCSNCPSASLVLELSINGNGVIEITTVEKDNIHCLNDENKEKLKYEMINSLINEWVFSKQFYYKVFTIRIGTALKC